MATVSADDLDRKEKNTQPLFRVISLIRETQCEIEVIKPVLDELEVLRLCHSFGMMSSVDVKDFEFDILNAREFDEDFARFLRTNLFENKCPSEVRLKGLFGKQTEVAVALADMKTCPPEIVTSLFQCSEGVYCVKVKADVMSNAEGVDAKLNDTLVVFSWIRDELFEPQALRDTPTLVLRFLTVLTPDVICCMSVTDLEQLRGAMIDSEKPQVEDLSSFSVSFCIEKQEDAQDGSRCVARTTINLHDILQGCSSMGFLKGSYPALSLMKTMNAQIRKEPFQRAFRRSARLSFAAWLKAESEQYRIKLSGSIVRTSTLCESILREFQMWPEAQVLEACRVRDNLHRHQYELRSKQLDDDITRQRMVVKAISKAIFQLGPNSADITNTLPQQEIVAQYVRFRAWVRANGVLKLDRQSMLKLDIPFRFRDIEQVLYELYCVDQNADVATVLGMCTTSTKAQLLAVIARRRARRRLLEGGSRCIGASWKSFAAKIAEPLTALQKQWWLAIEHCFSTVKTAHLDKWKCDQNVANCEDEATKGIIQNKFEELCTMLESRKSPLMTLSATMRKGSVSCKGTKEVPTLSFEIQEVVKINMEDGSSLEKLGYHVLNPNETSLALFTVKTRSTVQVCTSSGQMCVKFITFPSSKTTHENTSLANVKTIRTFGKIASICDFDSRTRSMVFLADDSIAIYKFGETFKQMERIKIIDLGVHSTLTALPFMDVFMLEKSVYVTDSSGCSQRFNISTDEISNPVKISDDSEVVQTSRLMPFADKLAVGMVCFQSQARGSLKGELNCVSVDNYRHLPALPLEVEFLSDSLQAQCIDKGVGIVDTAAELLYVMSIEVTVQSESCRLRQVDDDEQDAEVHETDAGQPECLRKLHWLYTFYHVFEKFPVQGLLNDGKRRAVSILVNCPVSTNFGVVLETCHDFFSLLMNDLMALNKPLQGLDLTKGLGVKHTSLDSTQMKTMSLATFFQTLVTFLPIQICRAEANALTLLQDGMSPQFDGLELDMEENCCWGTPEIAESIRFGLLSPLLCAWQGLCVVITSMGKQSTGKSYFLNHLTGSSFAIAGNRCTDGAWMSVRVLNDTLLIVLDFEGLGSFERTDQEDVFLAVLNASLSMFTIFRMEMRLDKEVDGLFTKFQQGLHLVKNDNRLFQGSLYMSVKDINPNDGSGVILEFKKKMQMLLTANCEENFINEMYSGKVSISCSPPLGTGGYYTSLSRAKQHVERIISAQAVSPFAYRSGESFHDCIRLLLAKISTLDWTSLDETSQQLQMKNLYRKLPGILRTGCLIPADFHTKEKLSKALMEPVGNTESDRALLQFDSLAKDHPEWLQQWPLLDRNNFLDRIEDAELDFGPSVCTPNSVSFEPLHLILAELFQQYLYFSSKGEYEKITEIDYAQFDVMLSFLVHRRKVKVALWVKQYLGQDRFMEEWEKLEHRHFVPFESILKRCNQQCATCQLPCLRSTCHLDDQDHDCGLSHVCRGLCEFCMMRLNDRMDQISQCICKAGHEGRCNCGKGDHTCGDKCTFSHAFNCKLICELKAGHTGQHRCSVKRHICGMPCSATKCNGKCITSVKRKHGVHECGSKQCNHLCEMDGCKERCSTADHFHDSPVLAYIFGPSFKTGSRMKHMCNKSHVCNGLCEEKGICSKVVRVSSSHFEGSYGDFDYDLKHMVAVQNKCAIDLKPGQLTHSGLHSCGKKSEAHGCPAKCEACEYYCDKVHGHRGVHSTSHGNMKNMHFVVQEDIERTEIDWNQHKYAPGEKAIAEMCNMYCSTGGRGHVHYLKCGYKNAGNCVYSGRADQRRHCDKSLVTPQPEFELDEVLHAEYWKTIGWKDPCQSALERAQFKKCPYACNAFEHQGYGKTPSCCDLPAWHPPATMSPNAISDKYQYINGHRFACSHVSSAGYLHHIFVLDCSGSMKGNSWQTLVKAVGAYLRGRMASGYNQDIASVVTFGDTGKIEYERMKIANAASQYVNFRGGGTHYAKGLREANALISRTNTKTYRPVVIFFTDGRPADRKEGLKVAKNIQQLYATWGLGAFVVGFGKASDVGLEELAKALGAKVHQARSVDMISDTFRSISKSLGACTGLICTKKA